MVTLRDLVYAAAFALELRRLGHGTERGTVGEDGQRRVERVDASKAAHEWATEAADAAERMRR